MNLHDRDIKKAAKEEGRAEGLAEGRSEGRNEKAVEAALMLIKEYHETPEIAAKK